MVDSLTSDFLTSGPQIGGHTLSTTVNGDTNGLWATAKVLKSIEDATEHLGDTYRKADEASTHAWTGEAADRFRTTLGRQRVRAYDLATSLSQVADDIARFADDIDAVKADMQKARDLARHMGYRTTRDMIQFPLPIVNPAASGTTGLITSLVSQARLRETAAHDHLRAALERKKTFLESLPTPTRGLGLTRGIFTASTGTQMYMNSALDRARTIVSASAIAENASGVLRQTAYQQMFHTAPWAGFDQAAAQIKRPLTYGAVDWVTLPADPQKAQYARTFLKPLHVSGAALGVTGIGLQVLQGAPPEKAVVTGGASWAAGALASGATEAALIALGVGAGPIGWATLAVGFVASAGVGYAIDQSWK